MLELLEPTTPEADVREACRTGDYRGATTTLIERYGPEVFGFVTALMRDDTWADDAFAAFCEDVWRGLPRFEWRTSARGWCFTIARHAVARLAKANGRLAARLTPLSAVSQLDLPEQLPRSETPAHRRSEAKSRIRALREQLPTDDQALLILRVDKQLPWAEVALALAAEGEALSRPALVRRTALVRKRFQLVKDELRELATAAGLIPHERV